MTRAAAGHFKKATGDFQEPPLPHHAIQAGAAGEPHLGITESVTWKAGATVQSAPCTCSLHAEAVGSPVAKTRSISPALPRGGGWGLWDLILFFFKYIYLAARGLSLCHVGSNPLTRDGSRGSCNGSPEPLNHQGSHLFWRGVGGAANSKFPAPFPFSHFPGWRSGQRSSGNPSAPKCLLVEDEECSEGWRPPKRKYG